MAFILIPMEHVKRKIIPEGQSKSILLHDVGINSHALYDDGKITFHRSWAAFWTCQIEFFLFAVEVFWGLRPHNNHVEFTHPFTHTFGLLRREIKVNEFALKYKQTLFFWVLIFMKIVNKHFPNLRALEAPKSFNLFSLTITSLSSFNPKMFENTSILPTKWANIRWIKTENVSGSNFKRFASRQRN